MFLNYLTDNQVLEETSAGRCTTSHPLHEIHPALQHTKTKVHILVYYHPGYVELVLIRHLFFNFVKHSALM